jgi:hypothetical protein
VRKAVVALLLLAAGCSSRNGAACPLSVPASGLTVNAGAFVAAHGQARVLRVCASTSAGCAGGVAERLRPRLAASVFVPLMPASRALHLRVVIDAPAGAVLLDKTASFRHPPRGGCRLPGHLLLPGQRNRQPRRRDRHPLSACSRLGHRGSRG